jgi:hypothetical protein
MGKLIYTECNSTFKKDFENNMRAIGEPFGITLPVPEDYFSDYKTALDTIKEILNFIDKHGAESSIAAFFVGKGLTTRAVQVVSAITAAAYLGFCVGSLLVATQGTIDRLTGGCKRPPAWSMNNVNKALAFAKKHKIYHPSLFSTLLSNHKILGALA